MNTTATKKLLKFIIKIILFAISAFALGGAFSYAYFLWHKKPNFSNLEKFNREPLKNNQVLLPSVDKAIVAGEKGLSNTINVQAAKAIENKIASEANIEAKTSNNKLTAKNPDAFNNEYNPISSASHTENKQPTPTPVEKEQTHKKNDNLRNILM